MAKRSEVALVIERLQAKKERLAEDLDLATTCSEEGIEKVSERLNREHAGVLSAIALLENARQPESNNKPKRERKKKGATTPAQGEL